jgi:hypothetical protein
MNLRRNGWRWFPYQALGLFSQAVVKLSLTRDGARGSLGHAYALDAILSRQRARYLETPDVHGPMALQQIRDFAPDFGPSLAAPILKESLSSIPALGAC